MQTNTQSEISLGGPSRHVSSPASTQGRLRILHVLNYLRRGGTEFGVLKLIGGLGDDTFEHHLCATRKFDPDFVRCYSLENILSVAGTSRPGLQFPLFRLRKIIRKYRPHIVHTRNWGALEAVFAARLAHVPVVIHSEHGYEVDNMDGFPLRQRLLRHQAYSMVDCFFTVTKQLREYHAKQGWIRPEAIRVIYNGVDTQRFSPSSDARSGGLRGELAIPQDRFIVGSVGRLEPIKDYATLLKAVERLVERGKNVHALLVGGGSELSNLQGLVNRCPALQGRVTFTGASDHVPELLQCIDAFVLPSRGEGMSNTLLEAMSSGLPILATRVGGNVEIVEEGRSGQFFVTGNPHDLASQLESLMEDSAARCRLGMAARNRAVSEFSLQSMFNQYRSLYMDAAVRRGVSLEPETR